MRRYKLELFNFLAKFTGSASLAEDIFQEAFLQVHISAGRFDPKRRFKPWLYTIAANKARDALRSQKRKRAVAIDATIAHDENETSYANILPGNIPAPDELTANLEARENVQNIVRNMPENLRAVLLLSYFKELAYKEIAEILDIPLGTVKSRLHAAVKHFARKWKGLYDGGGRAAPRGENES